MVLCLTRRCVWQLYSRVDGYVSKCIINSNKTENGIYLVNLEVWKGAREREREREREGGGRGMRRELFIRQLEKIDHLQ